MGNILEFPSRQAQGLAYLDQQLRQLLQSKGADQILVDFAANQLTELYSQLDTSEQYSFSVQLPAGLEEPDSLKLEEQINRGLEGLRAENHALMIKLVAQLVLAEVKLFQQQRND